MVAVLVREIHMGWITGIHANPLKLAHDGRPAIQQQRQRPLLHQQRRVVVGWPGSHRAAHAQKSKFDHNYPVGLTSLRRCSLASSMYSPRGAIFR